jgi:hypothetical protein
MGGVDEHARWHWCFLHGVEGRCLTARGFDALIVSKMAAWLDNITAGEDAPKRPETGWRMKVPVLRFMFIMAGQISL